MRMRPGEIHTKDAQADHFQGHYELIEHLGGRRWRTRDLPPDEAEIDRIIDYFATNEARGYGFDNTAEKLLAEVEKRSSGREIEIEFVSAEQYAAYF
jgi:SOS response regulatory protein OraA/RecX